jgi:hypothetical protein
MSAFGGKADIGGERRQCLLLTQSGHWYAVQDSDPMPTSDVRCITRQNALFDVGRVNAALLGFAEC